MRYYAEVPIHSPEGFIIGSLCVVDNKAREGLDSKGMRVLEEVAETIMDHLELCTSKIQRGRVSSDSTTSPILTSHPLQCPIYMWY
jgi:hypothetical protein